jgi:hypothetical protein
VPQPGQLLGVQEPEAVPLSRPRRRKLLLAFVRYTLLQFPRILLKPGVDVMITIFCDFRQFSAKKFAFFSKTNVMVNFLHNLVIFVSSQKRNFFAEFFGENILKIITSVPGPILFRLRRTFCFVSVWFFLCLCE